MPDALTPFMSNRNLGPSRVLVVDDDLDMQSLFELKFEAEALDYASATNGQEALEWLARESYGCVLLDLMMPIVDGFGVLESIRSRRPELLRNIVVFTGGSDELISRVDPGVFRVLKKTSPLADVIATVRACLGQELQAQK